MSRGRFAAVCLHTVWAPDPQDCAEPAVAVLSGTPLCEHHRAFRSWAAAEEAER